MGYKEESFTGFKTTTDSINVVYLDSMSLTHGYSQRHARLVYTVGFQKNLYSTAPKTQEFIFASVVPVAYSKYHPLLAVTTTTVSLDGGTNIF